MHATRKLRDVLARGDSGGIAGNRQGPVIDCGELSMQGALRREKNVSNGDTNDRGQARDDESQPLQNFFQDFTGRELKRRAI
jgi:hypothetical protein